MRAGAPSVFLLFAVGIITILNKAFRLLHSRARFEQC